MWKKKNIYIKLNHYGVHLKQFYKLTILQLKT